MAEQRSETKFQEQTDRKRAKEKRGGNRKTRRKQKGVAKGAKDNTTCILKGKRKTRRKPKLIAKGAKENEEQTERKTKGNAHLEHSGRNKREKQRE